MSATPETVRQVLASWIAVEALTPHDIKDDWGDLAADKEGRQRNTAASGPDGRSNWAAPQDDDNTPWITLADRPSPQPDVSAEAERSRPWHLVVLGSLPARESFERLDAVFADATDEDEIERRTRGHVVAATIVLDEFGILLPDSIAIASFAWGLGQALTTGPSAPFADWSVQEPDLKTRFSGILKPMEGGEFRSLTWRDLRDTSRELAATLGIPSELWETTPCSIEMVRKHPPRAEILSSFYLPDLLRVARDADRLPRAAAAYLGLQAPRNPWDALVDRQRVSELLRPGMFALGRWPGPGLHPLNLLQQVAVNAIVRDLRHDGLAAINGPPGTGKTTLLRDLVAHVLVSRAERLAQIDDPEKGLSGLDLMDFAMVVASSNNAAVENISLELPVRGKALDASLWSNRSFDYFGPTANAVLNTPPEMPEAECAWGLIAARLGSASNRKAFFEPFWWDQDWGLRDWLDLVAWPNTPGNRRRGKLAQMDPPPRPSEAKHACRTARDAFLQATTRCRRLRSELEELSAAAGELREAETRFPQAQERLLIAEQELASAVRAGAAAEADAAAHNARATAEAARVAELSAVLRSIAPSFVAKLFRTKSWRAHEAQTRELVATAEEFRTAEGSRPTTRARCGTVRRSLAVLMISQAGSTMRNREWLGPRCPGLVSGRSRKTSCKKLFHGTAVHSATRDAVFAAAIRLHRAFIIAAAKTIKPALETIARTGPDAPKPSADDWGAFFLVVPVVSTTFASIGRMFDRFGASDIGWLLIDEAGQAAPQAAVGAIWRARRAVVIGDPLQIEPVATTPKRTTRLLFERNQADVTRWAAPDHSAQTLADRASEIQGRFPVRGIRSQEERITGMPLLVHRRCEQPMFDLANTIAYANRMVFRTTPEKSAIRDVLGASAWIDVDAPSNDKWVQAEGHLIAAAIGRLCAALRSPPDLYVICPFRTPAHRLRSLLKQTASVLPGQSSSEREKWIEARVGTVHMFQGKEAEAVILMLGAGRNAKAGSRSWAGDSPNLLNVAATRAKRALYLVGNFDEWCRVGVFAEAARVFERRSAEEWWSSSMSVSELSLHLESS